MDLDCKMVKIAIFVSGKKKQLMSNFGTCTIVVEGNASNRNLNLKTFDSSLY